MRTGKTDSANLTDAAQGGQRANSSKTKPKKKTLVNFNFSCSDAILRSVKYKISKRDES